MPVTLLEEKRIWFPDPRTGEGNGLLAVGGDLSVKRLLLAYAHGIFPWYEDGLPYMWWCPLTRYVIYPSRIHVSHSMQKFLRHHDCRIQINRDFASVMHRCREKREEAGTWITDEMEEAYGELYRRGFAASVEAYVDGRLAGGLYGVTFNGCFFGESMFSDEENGSKIALILLARELEKRAFLLIDCQFHTEHLESMGGEYLDYASYMQMIRQRMRQNN